MGTNYYATTPKCKHCNRGDEPLHIGKSSGGWTFTFRGYKEDELSITSYENWIQYLNQPEVTIINEFRDTVTLDRFKEIVESKKFEQLNHARSVLDGTMQTQFPITGRYRAQNWLDEDGNSFSEGEFC